MIAERAQAERVALRAARVSARRRRRGAWAVTVLATAASTYALDAFAIAVGALLGGSRLLAGLDRPLLLAFLAATYVLWGAGLRANLAANWSLLRRTGASTNVLSKAAHDIARARGADAAPPCRLGRLRRHRARQGDPVLRERLRGGAAERFRLNRRRAHLHRRHEHRRGGLRVRARARDADVPAADILSVS
jgi:hypothetical protein